MNVIIDNPFTHGISQTKDLIVELIKVVSDHPDTEIDYDFGTEILEKDISISYNNLTISVTKIMIDRDYDFEEIPAAYSIYFSIEDRSYKYAFTSLDAEFIKLLMESL